MSHWYNQQYIHSFIRLWNVCISMEDWSCQNQKKNNVTKYTKHKCYHHFTRLFSLTLTQHVQDNAYCLRNKLFSAYCRISRWQMRLKRCSKLHEKHIYICCNIPQEEKSESQSYKPERWMTHPPKLHPFTALFKSWMSHLWMNAAVWLKPAQIVRTVWQSLTVAQFF